MGAVMGAGTDSVSSTSPALSLPPALPRVRQRGQAGFALPAVLAFLVMGTIITVAALSFALTALGVGRDVTVKNSELSAERSALDYAFTATRYDLNRGVEGSKDSYTVAGVTVRCSGQPGSGTTVGAGRTDRTVECATPTIRATVRFFDRSGTKAGVMVETLSWRVGN